MRAVQTSDVRLLVLGVDDAAKLHREYPLQLKIIRCNILRRYGLDNKGGNLSGQEDDKSPEADSSRRAVAVSASSTKRGALATDRNESLNRKKEDDNDWAEIRVALRETVKKRTLEDVYAFLHAVDRGDGEEVRRLLRTRDIDITWSDYDGRGFLHICAAHGKYGLVEILLEEGADTSATDRWHRCPLQVSLSVSIGKFGRSCCDVCIVSEGRGRE